MEYTEEQYQQEQSSQEQLAQVQLQQIQAQAQQDHYSQPINKDRDFMQWLFNFKEEVVGPLIHIWRGEEEVNPGDWKVPKSTDGKKPLVIMNDRGITWCSSFISSFINAVYVVSNYDENNMNATMRRVIRVVWNSLSRRYDEFGLRKIDIPRVAMEVWSKVHAILLGARGDGFRRFFMSTHHVDEVKTTQLQSPQQQQISGWGLFKKKQPMPQPGQMY